MDSDSIKYERILDIIKKSKPVLRSTDDMEERVIRRITGDITKEEPSGRVLDFLFGWVYIRWVRSGLVAASVILVAFFIYQQTVIIKQINNLNRQTVLIESQIFTDPSSEPDASSLYRLAGRRMPSLSGTISDKEMKRLMKSYNELEKKFKDLMKLIEEDPELKKYIEERLSENGKKKLKL